jgi:hypothetical protein
VLLSHLAGVVSLAGHNTHTQGTALNTLLLLLLLAPGRHP